VTVNWQSRRSAGRPIRAESITTCFPPSYIHDGTMNTDTDSSISHPYSTGEYPKLLAVLLILDAISEQNGRLHLPNGGHRHRRSTTKSQPLGILACMVQIVILPWLQPSEQPSSLHTHPQTNIPRSWLLSSVSRSGSSKPDESGSFKH
jgi:hypothetical protein